MSTIEKSPLIKGARLTPGPLRHCFRCGQSDYSRNAGRRCRVMFASSPRHLSECSRAAGGRYESDSEQQPTPSPRIKPGNIAYAAVFLASEESRMITGHILPVDLGIGD